MNTLSETVRAPWRQFLDTYEPLRPELYRYCRHLTRSPWDAEDLAQDTLARAFVTLAQMNAPPPSPRAWLFRVASNLWIDQRRRVRHESASVEPISPAPDPIATREAAGTLLGQLGPQERAAVVLKDVFDLSLEEVADALATTPGAIKAALHRARGKLVDPQVAAGAERVPAPGVLDAFANAFNTADMDRLCALLLDQASVRVVGATTEYGPEAARKTVLFGMLFGVKYLADPNAKMGIDWELRKTALDAPPRVELRNHRGEWLILHWYSHTDGDAVRAITRLDLDDADERVASLQNYFYNPEFIADVCGELGVPFRSNGHRWWKEI